MWTSPCDSRQVASGKWHGVRLHLYSCLVGPFEGDMMLFEIYNLWHACMVACWRRTQWWGTSTRNHLTVRTERKVFEFSRLSGTWKKHFSAVQRLRTTHSAKLHSLCWRKRNGSRSISPWYVWHLEEFKSCVVTWKQTEDSLRRVFTTERSPTDLSRGPEQTLTKRSVYARRTPVTIIQISVSSRT